MHAPEFHLRQAREQAWATFGKTLRVYLPGMFISNGVRGGYPAVSITGERCDLGCEHCQGTLLKTMRPATEPEDLWRLGMTLAEQGARGMLLSGGCDAQGRLPWRKFLSALTRLKETTELHISVHCGFLEDVEARALRDAGVDLALLDVVGSADTYAQVLHVADGMTRLRRTLDALGAAGLPVAPHIICGLHFGRMHGERAALELLAPLRPPLLVVVSFMPLAGTSLHAATPPTAQEVQALLLDARTLLPDTECGLGCARRRGNRELELLAIDAGVTRMALPSEEALAHAAAYGLAVEFRRTCCAVAHGPAEAPWLSAEGAA